MPHTHQSTSAGFLPALSALPVISAFFSHPENSTSQLPSLPELDENNHSLLPESPSGNAPALQSHPLLRSSSAPNTNTRSNSAMFSSKSPSIDPPSADSSREGSIASGGESEAKKRKRTSRSKTSYSICRAPPKSAARSKIQVRAKPLLQLHKLETQDRPKPAFELVPYAIFSTRIAKAIEKTFAARYHLSPTDLAIVRAEEYRGQDGDETRHVLALISGAGRKDTNASAKLKILLANGTEWDCRQLPSGSYECCSTDEHGLKQTVRWVRKKSSTKSVDAATELASSAVAEKKFNFSTISPNTRRHPVIANLTSTSLDISDIYNIPAPSAEPSEDSQQPGEPTKTTDTLRELITATAVCVAVREGWCPSHRSEDSVARSPSLKSVNSARYYASPPGSPSKLPAESMARIGTLRSMVRTPSLLRRSQRDERPKTSDSTSSMPAFGGDAMISSLTLDAAPATRRARANTTSTVIVNDVGAQWRPDFVEGPQEGSDDDNEDDEEGEDDESKNGPSEDEKEDEHHEDVAGPETVAKPMAEKPSLRTQERKSWRKSQTPSSFTDVSDVMNEKKVAQQARPKKKGLLQRLLCGMF